MPDEASTEIHPLKPGEPSDRTALVTNAPAFLCGRPIGEILVETAKLAPEKVEEALALQRGEQAGARLGEILVRMKAAGELDVLRALAIQLDLPFLERIDLEAVPGELAAKVPIHFAKQARVLPLGM
ncbi:MAG TPA: type II secretion system protein GspE, partial [Anaeromyxobacter sp.]